MIKQTRGALTMLLSVYRSVLKNAYLKNFAAVALAASVGVASAEELGENGFYTTVEAAIAGSDVDVKTNQTIDSSSGNGFAKNVTVSGSDAEVTLTIDGSSVASQLSTNSVTIGKNGTVALSGSSNGATIAGLKDTPAESEGALPANITLKDSTSKLTASGKTSVGNVTLEDGTATFGDTATVNSLNATKGTVDVGSDATVEITKDLTIGDGVSLVNGGTSLTVKGKAEIGALKTSSKLGTAVFEGDAKFTAANMSIAGTDNLTFKGNASFDGNVTNNATTFTVAAEKTAKFAKALTNLATMNVTGTLEVLGDLVNGRAAVSAINDQGAVDAVVGNLTVADATLSKVNNANGSITINKSATVSGAFSNGTAAVTQNENDGIHGVTAADGTVNVESNANVTFESTFANNTEGSTLTVKAGGSSDNTTNVTFKDAVVNKGKIVVKEDSVVKFEKSLDNSGILETASALDFTDNKLTNTGTIDIKANGKVTTEFNKDLGLTAETPTAKVINVGELNIKGTATVKQGIFTNTAAGVTGQIYNGGTLSVDKLVVSDTDADITLANAGKLNVGDLEISKKLAVADGVTLTVSKSITSNATADGDKVIGQTTGTLDLVNEGKTEGFLKGFKTVALDAVKGLWNFGGAAVSAASIGEAAPAKASTVTGIGELSGATIVNASVEADTVKASGTNVQVTGNSTLTVKNVTASAGEGAAINATNSTVKITGEYTAVSGGLVADLTGSTLELNANNNKSAADIETIKGDATSTLVINGVGKVKVVKDSELTAPVADAEDATVRTLADVYHSIGIKSGSGHYEGIIKGLTYDTNIEELVAGKISKDDIAQYSTVASSTDAFATAQVTGVDGTALTSKLNVGSILADNGIDTVKIDANGDIALNTAKDGLLVAQAGSGTAAATAANVNFTGAGKLTLNDVGKVGNIDGNGTLIVNKDVTAGKIGGTTAIGTLDIASGSLTADSLNAATATINGGLKLTKVGTATGALTTTGKLETGKNAVVTAENIAVGDNSSLSGNVTVKGDLTVADTKTLDIGKVTGGVVDSYGTVTVNQLKAASSTIGTVSVNAGSLTVTGDDATSLNTLNVGKAGSVSFTKDVALSSASTVEGSLSANKLSAGNTLAVNNGGKVTVTELDGAGAITVGQDGVNNGTGSIYAKTLKATGTIFIDPEFGQQAAFVGAENLNTVGGIEVTTGDIVVGKNAALAVGVSSVDQARSVLSSLGLTDANGSFKQNGVENAIYTDALVKIASDKALDINSANDTATRSSVPNIGTPGSATLENGQIHLADKSAVVIGKNAAAKSVQTGNAVLTADNATVGVRATGNSKVIFAGNPTKQDIKDVKVFSNAGGTKVIDASEVDNVSVQISPLYNLAKLTVDGGITDITVNRGYINTALYNASLPVKNMVAEVADTALTGDGVGSDFIMENALVDGGANIESAARLATFGGAYQAAAAAVNTAVEAAQARLGLGIDNSAEVKGENVSVWANAVYKNTESDSFEAQGTTYGSDLDLTSLVIGADYGIAEGSKIGAYASFGTGDVDGKGAGHNVKNDVDTYGFGIYGSTKLASGVSILSDVGYTVAQNEFKGIVSADADMKVFTAGANVKYTFNTQVADITPFVGARYTSFNLENYAVKSAKGIVANTDADTAHIFSIPVGFDLSKQIAAGEWNVKPALTAKVTFNTGDKTVSSSTQFTGVKNALNLDAEVMDDVTYSVGASVSATKGAATFGAGLSYTGSSETNELSAQVGARYTF